MTFQSSLEGKVINQLGATRAFVEKFLALFPYVRDVPNFEFLDLYYDWCKTYGYPISDPESIRRTRQKIQNTNGKYKPTKEVMEYRKARAEVIRANIKFI